jgi:hypothetical protein
MAPRERRLIAALLLAPPLLLAAAEQERIAFGAAEVQLPSLAIGRTYSTWHLAQAPVVVDNTSADTIRVRIDVVVTARHQLRSGALPVPDRSWIQLEAEQLVVPHPFGTPTRCSSAVSAGSRRAPARPLLAPSCPRMEGQAQRTVTGSCSRWRWTTATTRNRLRVRRTSPYPPSL